jgi:hypothetical protein
MIDSERRSDLFRRYGVIAPWRCASASRSSRFLVSAKNLCRGHRLSSAEAFAQETTIACAVDTPSFARVITNNPG